uniref:Uncharacterized protein n=1 Tax=Oryza barthii TaxID=65489 RepID=A0A075BQF6_9ORYZ|nr:hypothetical protein OB_ABa0085D15.1 [Oryza barthii]
MAMCPSFSRGHTTKLRGERRTRRGAGSDTYVTHAHATSHMHKAGMHACASSTPVARCCAGPRPPATAHACALLRHGGGDGDGWADPAAPNPWRRICPPDGQIGQGRGCSGRAVAAAVAGSRRRDENLRRHGAHSDDGVSGWPTGGAQQLVGWPATTGDRGTTGGCVGRRGADNVGGVGRRRQWLVQREMRGVCHCSVVGASSGRCSERRQGVADRGMRRLAGGAPVQWCPRVDGGLDGSGASLRQWWIGRQLMANENPARL